MKTAYFAGGCFWCMAPVFRDQPGVSGVVSGYCGGEGAPTYEEVKAQQTAHRETVAITYDPAAVTFAALTELFLSVTDPFDAGGQFIDRGRSYTLAVYYTDGSERRTALDRLAALQKLTGQKPAVSVEPFRGFFAAEEYHQDYDLKHPEEFARELRESGRKARS